MPRERRNYSDEYSENLIPTRVTITRQRGHLTYVFEIDGYVGERTGEVHFKGSEVSRIDRMMENQAIQSYTLHNLGLVVNFETPNVVAANGMSTGSAMTSLEAYGQPESKTIVIFDPHLIVT